MTQQHAAAGKTRQFETDNYVLQSDLNTAFNLFGMRNELVTGVEYLNEDSIRWACATSAPRPLIRSTGLAVHTAPPATYKGETYSAYVQDTLEFIPDWKLTLGVRRDIHAFGVFHHHGLQRQLQREQLSCRPVLAADRGAALLRRVERFVQPDGRPLPTVRQPVSGRALQGRRTGQQSGCSPMATFLRTSLYRAIKDWERNTDLESTRDHPDPQAPVGWCRTGSGRPITDNWEVFSGISYIHAEIREVAPGNGNPNFIGQAPRNTPKKTFNLWTTYQLPYGFKVGGGMEYKSRRYGGSPTGTAAFNPNWVDSYTRWDAMVSYDQPKYAGQVQRPEHFRQGVLRRPV